MDRDYVGISIERYTRYIFEHRPTRDGRGNVDFDSLSASDQQEWKARAIRQISYFLFHSDTHEDDDE